MVFVTRNNLDKIEDSDIISQKKKKEKKNIKFLGVILHPYLIFKDPITNKSKIDMKFSHSKPAQNVHVFSCTHSDYSNAILIDSPNTITKWFQPIQNFVAKTVFNKRKQASATEYLKELHFYLVNWDTHIWQ